MNKFYIIPNSKDISSIKDDLILPLKEYSIGYDVYFTIDEVNEISKSRKVSVVINKMFHKSLLDNFILIKDKLNVEYYFIEDYGLSNILIKDKVVLMGSHIINNYVTVNSLNNIGYNNIVINNELTIDEIVNIRNNTTSNLFYTLIARNNLMYSKRPLLTSYYNHFNISERKVNTIIKEKTSKKELIIKEEDKCSCIFDKNIFSANKYINLLKGYNFIINLNNMTRSEVDIILNHYKDVEIDKYIYVDNYFLDNKIIYKLGVNK